MSLSIALATDKLPEKGSLIITATDGGKLGTLGKQLDKKIGGAISKAIKIKKFTGKPASMFALLAPAKTDLDRIVVLGVGDGKKLGAADAEKMGGTALGAVEKAEGNVTFLLEPLGSNVADGEIAARAAVGAYLRDYKFETYKTKNKSSTGPKKFTVATKAATAAKKAFAELKAIADGTIVARNLVNEPSNILTPPEFAKRTKALTKLGVKVEVLSEAQMKKLGMGSLLGVGQGSEHPSQMVVMQWQGAAKSKKPLAFIGKGVCFDTGGISIKPSAGMEDMKGDMGGAAAVTGLMHALATRKAKAN
ncbi:MAG: leucyl aminopeptidase family protein, partial [Parvibaculales bacterium]